VSERGLLRLTGPQRIWFLQQTITADVEDVPAGEVRESVFLTPKGKVLAHFYVGVLDGEVYLDIDPPPTDLADWLVRYRFRTKVEIEDLSGEAVTLVGPRAAELVADGTVRKDGDAVLFGRRLGEVPIAVVHRGGAEGASDEEVERLRIVAGVPRFGVDYTTDHLPQEAGLTRIVPIDKGCYVGQETVARIHFRGHVNKVARPLELRDADPATAVGAELSLNGAGIGRITSAEPGGAAIGMVRVEPPARAEVDVSGGGTAILGPVPEGTKVRASPERS
jgi:folate-binding protein YgfZ